ncbi:MAG: response regulator [Gammaproteobacteria bacterium]|nr:response regulator [Gammaproteobacteria bacterium]
MKSEDQTTTVDLVNHERHQAGIRVVAGAVGFYALFFLQTQPPLSLLTAQATILLLLPLAIWLWVRADARVTGWRPLLGLLLDCVMLTALLHTGPAQTAPLALLYGVVGFDHLRRFGASHLLLLAAPIAAGFGALLLINDYWQQNLLLGTTLLCALLLPLLYRQVTPAAVPARQDEAATPVQSQDEEQAQLPRPPPRVANGDNLQGKRVLLLSSDMEDRYGIVEQLETWGTLTVKCENAARALHALIDAHKSAGPFHGVIVDHGRIGMDDAQFAQLVRSEALLQGLYLIHIGFDNQGRQRDKLLHAGYTRLLSTPVSKTFLFDALQSTYAKPEADQQVVRLIDHVATRSGHQPLSLLVADDEFSTRQRLMALLKKAGHRVFSVNNGARVLDALDSHRFDMALVSSNIREVSGLEAFKLYRFTRIDRQWVPFIMLIEDEKKEAEFIARCRDAGISATIERHAEPSVYLEAIEKVAKEISSEPHLLRGGQRTAAGSDGAESGSTLDTNRLMEIERLGGGMKLLSDLIDSFNRDNRRILTAMKRAAEKGQAGQFRDLGHALKDGAGGLGTIKLFTLATAATRIGDADFPETAQALLQEITECCRLSNNALHAYLIGQDASENDSHFD